MTDGFNMVTYLYVPISLFGIAVSACMRVCVCVCVCGCMCVHQCLLQCRIPNQSARKMYVICVKA